MIEKKEEDPVLLFEGLPFLEEEEEKVVHDLEEQNMDFKPMIEPKDLLLEEEKHDLILQ